MFHIYEGFHLVDAYHKVRHQRKYHPEDKAKRGIKIALVALVTLLLWNMPAEWYGIQNLTVIQQRIIAIFAFATLMWVLEVVSSWATSVAIIVLMLLFCTDGGMGTPIGTPPNTIAQKYLNDPEGLNLGLGFGHSAYLYPAKRAGLRDWLCEAGGHGEDGYHHGYA